MNPMSTSILRSSSMKSAAALVALSAFAIGLALASPAQAASPEVFLDSSMIVGAGGTLAIDQLQFTTSAGAVKCDNVTIPFNVGSTGSLVIGTPEVTTCVSLQTNHFVPGTYVILGYPKDNTIKVTGPAVGVGGSTVWSLSASPTIDSGTWVLDARWTVGPLSDNPEAQAYLKTCSNITPDPNASYGLGSPYFSANTLMAMVQTAGNLTIQAYNGCSVLFTKTYSFTGS
jgi:hypothetical protein